MISLKWERPIAERVHGPLAPLVLEAHFTIHDEVVLSPVFYVAKNAI